MDEYTRWLERVRAMVQHQLPGWCIAFGEDEEVVSAWAEPGGSFVVLGSPAVWLGAFSMSSMAEVEEAEPYPSVLLAMWTPRMPSDVWAARYRAGLLDPPKVGGDEHWWADGQPGGGRLLPHDQLPERWRP